MANNILEPFYLDLVQRETAHREQLRQQQLEQELQLTYNRQPDDAEPELQPQNPFEFEPCSSPRRGETVSDHEEDHPTAEPASPTRTVGADVSLPAVAGPAQSPRRKPSSSPRRGEAVPPRRKSPNGTNLNYHSPQCSICNHPEREDIDRAILHWHSPTAIAYEFDLPDRRIIYRHAHALGLFRLRAQQSRHALGFLIEQAQSIVPSADALIRAVRAFSCIDDHGQWHEPRKEVVITHRYVALQARQDEDATKPADDDCAADPNRIGVPSDQRESRGRSRRPRRHRDSQLRTPEAASHRRENRSPLPAAAALKRGNWSTRLLSKFRRKSNSTNKAEKIGRHTFDVFGESERRATRRTDREAS